MSSRRATFYDQRSPMAAPVATRSREFEEVDSYVKRSEWRNRPDFLNKDYEKNNQGPIVVRERETERVSRRSDRQSRPSSPIRSSTRERIVTRELSPPRGERSRARVVEREREREKVRERSLPPPDRVLARIVDPRERVREHSASSRSIQTSRREKHEKKERERSITPPVEQVHSRKSERHESHRPSLAAPSSPPAPPTPPPIQAPPIHQEIITHHRHINHGFETAKPSTPPPSARREIVVKETEEEIYRSPHDRGFNVSRRELSEVKTITKRSQSRPRNYNDDTIVCELDKRNLNGQDIRIEISQRRSRSARPETVRIEIRDDEDEADYYARKNEERATIGEAKNGVTKDWATIDVPPGTERVILDGVGGASQEITWQKYSGVRRSKFIPDRENTDVREFSPAPRRENTRKNLEFRDDSEYKSPNLEMGLTHGPSRRRNGANSYDHEYEREYERIEEGTDWQDSVAKQPKHRGSDLWTEVTKDLVTREAIEELGYDYEETEYFYYILQYLRYEDVVELVNLSNQIRHERHQRLREIEWELRQLEMKDME